jgi:hypothetical protein
MHLILEFGASIRANSQAVQVLWMVDRTQSKIGLKQYDKCGFKLLLRKLNGDFILIFSYLQKLNLPELHCLQPSDHTQVDNWILLLRWAFHEKQTML